MLYNVLYNIVDLGYPVEELVHAILAPSLKLAELWITIHICVTFTLIDIITHASLKLATKHIFKITLR